MNVQFKKCLAFNVGPMALFVCDMRVHCVDVIVTVESTEEGSST